MRSCFFAIMTRGMTMGEVMEEKTEDMEIEMQELEEDELRDVSLNVLLVEDQFDEMEAAADMIKKHFPEINVCEAGSKKKAWEKLEECNIDLLLLDIGLPDGNGFELTREIRECPRYRFLHIVYITGEAHDPLSTYNTYHCYSFIKKPYEENFLIKQLWPLIRLLKQEKAEGMQAVRNKVVTFPVYGGERTIPLNEIVYIGIEARKVILHTTSDEVVVKGYTMDKIMDYIDDPRFIRCHHGFIINTDHMTGINRDDGNAAVAEFDTGDAGCMISQRKVAAMRRLLEARAADSEEE